MNPFSGSSEVWRSVGTCPGYSVSNRGRIRNDRSGRVLKPFPRGYENQYLGVNLSVNGKKIPYLVHRLVAIAFVSGRTEDRNEVNHYDVDTRNNHCDNLEWVTRSENEYHKRFMQATDPIVTAMYS